jgi:hypothetical protein
MFKSLKVVLGSTLDNMQDQGMLEWCDLTERKAKEFYTWDRVMWNCYRKLTETPSAQCYKDVVKDLKKEKDLWEEVEGQLHEFITAELEPGYFKD